MADVVATSQARPRSRAQTESVARRRRDDRWIGTTALFAALLTLPLAQSSWHGSEVAAVLAVAATALLAGERWAIAVVAVAELLLAPSVAAHAFVGGLALWPGRIASLAALIAIVPGLLALRRAAATLVIVTGRERSRAMCRRFQIGLVIVGVLAMLVPLI